MDFTTLSGFYFSYVEDPVTGVITLTIENKERTVTLGTIVAEKTKFGAITQSISEIAKEFQDEFFTKLEIIPVSDSYGAILGAGTPSDLLYADPMVRPLLFEGVRVGDIVGISDSPGYNGNYFIIEKIDSQRVRLNTTFDADLILTGRYTVTRIFWKRRTLLMKNTKSGTTEFFV